MKNYEGKKVLIWGLGINGGGLGMAEYFARQKAVLTVTDLKTEKELKTSILKLKKYKNIKYVLGKHRGKDFINNDIIVKNPGVPPKTKFEKIALEHNKKIIIELLYVISNFPGKIIGVTGTKGKSTTTTLIKHVLGTNNVFAGGNLQTSTVKILEKANKNSIAVLEIPSYQLEYIDSIKKSPNIAVITNIKDDHITWHGTLKKYQKAKTNIFKYQKKTDTCVINLDDDFSSKIIKKIPGKVVGVSSTNKLADIYFDANSNIYLNGQKTININNSPIKGKYNLKNVCLAYAVCKLLGVSDKVFLKKLEAYKGIENRQQVVGFYKGITFVNDTTATHPDSVLCAIEAFKEKYTGKIIMIAGGVDKNMDFSQIKNPLKDNLKALLLFEGSASPKIYEVMKNTKVPIEKYFDSMEKVVKRAVVRANKGDLIILCPIAASFNMFANEFDRGRQFVKCVKNEFK